MKKKYLWLIVPTLLMLNSCDYIKGKAKRTINKSGEIVSKSGSEFVSGVESGIEKSFASRVILSDELKNSGLEVGKVTVSRTEGGTDNVLTVYLIFNREFSKAILVKIYNESGEEYGRTSQIVEAVAKDAKHVDFIFDERTDIEGKGKILIE